MFHSIHLYLFAKYPLAISLFYLAWFFQPDTTLFSVHLFELTFPRIFDAPLCIRYLIFWWLLYFKRS
jgi:hypothetical protein